MYNMNEKQTSLKTLATDTCDIIDQVSLVNEIATDHLNLKKVGMAPPHVCL